MTRKEYLKQLKRQIAALPLDEQTEALDYYTNYFEDAGNDDAVIAELGTPEELAQTIKDKFACVPAKQDFKEDGQTGGGTDSRKRTSDTGRSVQFDKKDVRSLDISLGVAEIVVISGTSYSVETRGMEPSDLRCVLSPYGTLSIDNTRKFPVFDVLRRGNRKNWHPRILITVPEQAELDMLKIHVGAGSFVTKDVSITSSKTFLDVGAGNLVIGTLYGGRIDVRCGMGNVEVRGTATGFSRLECGMGNIKFALQGKRDEYSYDAKVGLGEVKVNGEKRSGVCDAQSANRQPNHFSVVCGMGAVSIDIA